jgi:hypothetical protein
MATYTYEHPNEIDGEPSDVRTVSVAQLEGITRLVATLADQTARQVLNAALTDVLKADREVTQDELAQRARDLRPKELHLMQKVASNAAELSRLARLLEQARAEYDEANPR